MRNGNNIQDRNVLNCFLLTIYILGCRRGEQLLDELKTDIAGLYGTQENRSPLLPKGPLSYKEYLHYLRKDGMYLETRHFSSNPDISVIESGHFMDRI